MHLYGTPAYTVPVDGAYIEGQYLTVAKGRFLIKTP